jgi:hypothetical protein
VLGRPAKEGVHASLELAYPKWLGQVVVGAAFEPAHAFVIAGPGGQHQDRCVVQLGSQAARDRNAVDLGEHPVQDNQVVRSRLRLVQPRFPVERHFHAAGQILQAALDQHGDIWFILYDEYAASHRGQRSLGRPRRYEDSADSRARARARVALVLSPWRASSKARGSLAHLRSS